MANSVDIPSPCVGICQLEPVTGLCRGCLRTTAEIAAWSRATFNERLAIVVELRQRRRARGQTSAADRRPRRRSRR